ncbi:MAG: hypothetical protein PVI40_05010 [Chlamydiota bacterium]|jgi:hypothetical protein
MTSLIQFFFPRDTGSTNSSQDSSNFDYLASVPAELFQEIVQFSGNLRFLPTIAQLDGREIARINNQTNDKPQVQHTLKLAKMSEEIIFSSVESHAYVFPITLAKIVHTDQLAAFLDMVDLYKVLNQEKEAEEMLNQAKLLSMHYKIDLEEVKEYRLKNRTAVEERLFNQVKEVNRIFHEKNNNNLTLSKEIKIFCENLATLAEKSSIIPASFIKKVESSLKAAETSVWDLPDEFQKSLAFKKIVVTHIAFGKLEDAERVAHLIPDMVFNFIEGAEDSSGDIRYEAFEEIASAYIELRNFESAKSVIHKVSTLELSEERKEAIASILDRIARKEMGL